VHTAVLFSTLRNDFNSIAGHCAPTCVREKLVESSRKVPEKEQGKRERERERERKRSARCINTKLHFWSGDEATRYAADQIMRMAGRGEREKGKKKNAKKPRKSKRAVGSAA